MSEPNHSPPPSSFGRRAFMQTALLVQGGLVVLAFALGWLSGERFWVDASFTLYAIGLGLLGCAPLVVAAIGLANAEWRWARSLQHDFDRLIELFRACTVTDLFIVSLLAGVGEEALFRGVLQAYAADLMHPWLAIAIVSIIFGALHAVSRAYAIGVTVIGVYLGAIYYWTDNIVVPMIIHGAYDFIALIYAVRFHGRRE